MWWRGFCHAATKANSVENHTLTHVYKVIMQMKSGITYPDLIKVPAFAIRGLSRYFILLDIPIKIIIPS